MAAAPLPAQDPAGRAYDQLGLTYRHHRRPDPRLERPIHEALGRARRVVNVGAGTGSYEPADRPVVAVEPSAVMAAQRPSGSAPCVRARAEQLPYPDASFDAAMALLTVHHWADPAAGLAELRRVAPARQVVVSWDADVNNAHWLVAEYLPGIVGLSERQSTVVEVVATLERAESGPLMIPADCTDGFFGAYWRRPEAYLDPSIRNGISTFSMIDADEVADGMARLAADLDSGAWYRRHEDLLTLDEFDVGYRLIVAGSQKV
jgi:SAM-dependent methyltransferase